jgi:hypothetical protein
VKHHPGGFVAPKPKLALEKQCRNAPLVGGHQVGCPEPKGSAGSWYCAGRSARSARLGSNRRHTPSAFVPPARSRECGRIGDTCNPRASGTWPSTAGRPPRWRTGAETGGPSWGRAGKAPSYTTGSGYLKQPDKHEPTTPAPSAQGEHRWWLPLGARPPFRPGDLNQRRLTAAG